MHHVNGSASASRIPQLCFMNSYRVINCVIIMNTDFYIMFRLYEPSLLWAPFVYLSVWLFQVWKVGSVTFRSAETFTVSVEFWIYFKVSVVILFPVFILKLMLGVVIFFIVFVLCDVFLGVSMFWCPGHFVNQNHYWLLQVEEVSSFMIALVPNWGNKLGRYSAVISAYWKLTNYGI